MFTYEMNCNCTYILRLPCYLALYRLDYQRPPIGFLPCAAHCLAHSALQLACLLTTQSYRNVERQAPQPCGGQPSEWAKEPASSRMVHCEVWHHAGAEGREDLSASMRHRGPSAFLYAREITPTHLIAHERRSALAEPQKDAKDGLCRR